MPHAASLSDVARRARRAYEVARARRGLMRAAPLGALLGLASLIAVGAGALAWLPVFVALWTLLEWRGGALLRGGRVGGVVGGILALAPASVFMACCRVGCSIASGVCCSTSRACAAIGALAGLFVAGLLARVPTRDRARATAGAALGLVATAVPRCSSLLYGEAIGLLLGLIAGTAAATLVWATIDRLRQPA